MFRNSASFQFRRKCFRDSHIFNYSKLHFSSSPLILNSNLPWKSEVIPYGIEFSLLGGNNIHEHHDLYIHCLEHTSQFQLHLMVNPRLKHCYQSKFIHPQTLRTKRPNVNSRNRDDIKWEVLMQLLTMASHRFGDLSQPQTKLQSHSKSQSLSCSSISFGDNYNGIYEQDLWLHLQSDYVPRLDPLIWRKCLHDLNQLIYSKIFNVQYWFHDRLSTYEVILDELDVIRELIGAPDNFLQKKIESMYFELFPKYGGSLAIVSSTDIIFQLKEEMENWFSQRNISSNLLTFEKQSPLIPSLSKASQEIKVVEFPSYSDKTDYEYISITYQLPESVSELHSNVLYLIQDKLLSYKSPLQQNLTKVLGIHPQSQNDLLYCPISRSIEFTFPIEQGKKVPAIEIANLITASLQYLITNEKHCSTFLQESITSIELESMKNSNHFKQWCNYLNYRNMKPLTNFNYDTVQMDPFFNKLYVIKELKNNGKKILNELFSELLKYRTTIIYRPSEQWKNRVERSLRRILKVDPNENFMINTKLLKQKQPDVFTTLDIDPPFHKSAFSQASELVQISPSLSIVLDYTSRGDLIDVALLTIPKTPSAFFSNPFGFISLMSNYMAYLGIKSVKKEDYFKESSQWTSGISSSSYIYLKPIASRDKNIIGAIPSLLLETTCAEKTFHIAVDQFVELLSETQLLNIEKVNLADIRESGNDFTQKIISEMFPLSIDKCKKHIMSFSLWGFIYSQLNGLHCVSQIQPLIQNPDKISGEKTNSEAKKLEENLKLSLTHFTTHYLHFPLKRIFMITADLKHRDSIIEEVKRIQSKLSIEQSEEEIKKSEFHSSLALSELDTEINKFPKDKNFIQYSEGTNSPYIATVAFNFPSLINMKQYSHGLIFSELLKKVIQQKFNDKESSELFESIDIELHWSGVFLISGSTYKDNSLSYFFKLIEESINWILDNSNHEALEKITDSYDVYARSCRILEKNTEEFQRTFKIYDLLGFYEPQEVKDTLLSKVTIQEVAHTIEKYLNASNKRIEIDKERILIFGSKTPIIVKQNENWNITKIN